MTRATRSELRQILSQRLDEEELRTLCFDLDVDYDDLPGRGKTNKARDLLAHLIQRRRLPDLIQTGQKLRPDIQWPQITPTTEPAQHPLPNGSRLPFRRNHIFTGRLTPLQQLLQTLLPPSPTPQVSNSPCLITQAVQGMGGIGKTQLAVEFAYRYGGRFEGVHWINAAQPATIGAEIAICGQAMDLPGWPAELPAQITRTLDEWQGGGPRLVILDNLENVAAAREWLGRLDGGPVRVLLTARRTDWPHDMGLDLLRLEFFSPAESHAFLRQYLPAGRAPDADLHALAERLYHLPLALELAGRYLQRLPRLTIPAYLDKLATVWTHPSMAGWRADLGNPTNHDLGLAATFAASWAEVDTAAARRLFLLAGYCAPNQPIPYPLLEQAAELDTETCDDGLAVLIGLGLLKTGDSENGPAIHPLLAEYARNIVGDEGDVTPVPALVNTLATLGTQANQTGLPANFVPLHPHVETVLFRAETSESEQIGTLWNELGYYLHHMVADYSGARQAFERALEMDEAAHDPDHPNVAIRVNNLGMVMKDLGDLEGARKACEWALEIGEAAHGPNHPNVATAVNNLGSVLQDQGDLEGARKAYERALEIDEAFYGPDHPQVAIRVNNLGLMLQAQSDLEGARKAFERALEIFAKFLPPDHPNIATVRRNLESLD